MKPKSVLTGAAPRRTQAGMADPPDKPPSKPKPAPREEKLAAALRANLKRRKGKPPPVPKA